MLTFLKSIFTGGGLNVIESIASEWIETNQERAEAQAVMIKAIDPNGKMRRDLSRFTCQAYGFYLLAMVTLSFMVAFNVGDADGAVVAATMMQDLFVPITAAWGTIVGASFGVNGINSYKGRP